jgi:hypothetical protein
MEACYIERHNAAVRCIQQKVGKAGLAAYYTIMDASKAKDVPEDVDGTRIPAWMLPQLPETTRNSMRPDLLIVEGLAQSEVTQMIKTGARPQPDNTTYKLCDGHQIPRKEGGKDIPTS